jgi:hypothetical protein
MKGIGLICIGMLLMVGCNHQPLEVLVLEPECLEWTICTSPQQTMYNVSEGDCMAGLSPGQAQKFFDILVKHNIKIEYLECSKKIMNIDELTIRQVELPGG